MRELLLERERLAMTVADRDSYFAQRHFVVSAQLRPPSIIALMTWEFAYLQQRNSWIDAQAAMRAALHAVRRGDNEAAEDFLVAEVGSEQTLEAVEAEEGEAADEAMEEEEEEEEAEEDEEVAPA